MNTHHIATEAATRWTIQLRQWLGHDVPEHWTKSLTTIIEAAIVKATELLQQECNRYVAQNAKLIRAAHASGEISPSSKKPVNDTGRGEAKGLGEHIYRALEWFE